MCSDFCDTKIDIFSPNCNDDLNKYNEPALFCHSDFWMNWPPIYTFNATTYQLKRQVFSIFYAQAIIMFKQYFQMFKKIFLN